MNDNRDWIDVLRERLLDHEEPVPEGLFERIYPRSQEESPQEEACPAMEHCSSCSCGRGHLCRRQSRRQLCRQ